MLASDFRGIAHRALALGRQYARAHGTAAPARLSNAELLAALKLAYELVYVPEIDAIAEREGWVKS
jgi:hypothetical protein